MSENIEESSGLSRRTVLKRGAAIAGGVVWATPIVQSMGSPAFAADAAGSGCSLSVIFDPDQMPGGTGCLLIGRAILPSECCEVVDPDAGLPGLPPNCTPISFEVISPAQPTACP
jgi:hypothetical protein